MNLGQILPQNDQQVKSVNGFSHETQADPVAEIVRSMGIQCRKSERPPQSLSADSIYNPPILKRTIEEFRQDMLKKAETLYDVESACECANNGERGDAELIYSVFNNEVVHDHAESQDYFWNQLHWQPDNERNIPLIATDIATAVYKRAWLDKQKEALQLSLALGGENPDELTSKRLKIIKGQLTAIKDRLQTIQRLKGIESVLGYARAGLKLGISGNEWHNNPNLLGVANGVIDLETIQPVLPYKEQYIRVVTPAPYIAGWKYALFEKTVKEIFDGNVDKYNYLRRLLGYALSGTCRESDFIILYGKHGRNGKELITGAINDTLGDALSGILEAELLLKSKNKRSADAPTEALMVLRGRRFVWASETEQGRVFSLDMLKAISGGHKLTGRHGHQKQTEWKRTHTPFFLTNHLPHIPSQGLAEWDRVKVLTFPLSFIDQPDPTKPEHKKKDGTLPLRIREQELPGVLNWLLEGLREWRNGGLQTPQCVKNDTNAYRKTEDTLGKFIEEACEVDPKYVPNSNESNISCKPTQLYRHYTRWAGEASAGKALGKHTFYDEVENRGFKKVAIKGNDTFKGIGVGSYDFGEPTHTKGGNTFDLDGAC